ncbi:MAG: bifunctional UDP-sugar hydrolase/5'-nucleotidase [Bacteroidales bacterium]
MVKLQDIKYLRHIAITACLIILLFNTVYATNKENKKLTILFTNDIHSNAEEQSLQYESRIVKNGDTLNIIGGYARLATLIKQEREKAQKEGTALILVDAGDMAMGTIFHSVYTDEAFELRTMARLKYDAYTFGNHDFDYGANAIAKMLIRAFMAEDSLSNKLPYILAANIKPINSPLADSAFNIVKVKNSVIIEKQGIKIGIIGLLGEQAYSVSMAQENFTLTPPIEAAQREVALLKKEGVDYIIAISHGGTLLKGKSEDVKIAKAVPQINIIISGHDHEYLFTPLIINKTIIGSTGGYNCTLGKMVIEKDSLISYELIPITKNVIPNSITKAWVDSMSQKIDKKFYNEFGVHPFDTIGKILNNYNNVPNKDGNLDLGYLIAKSYKYAALKYSQNANDSNLIGIAPLGIIRNTLFKGYVTYNNVFNVLSLGKNSNNKPGYPLVMAWLYGKELYDVCEMVATVSPNMTDALLFFDGLTFTYNSHKLPFTKVTDIKVNGRPIDKTKLYPIVTGMYTAKLIGLLKSKSYGILSAQPKGKNGIIITDLQNCIIKKPDVNSGKIIEIAEWMAFAEFLSQEVVEKENVKILKSAINNSSYKVYYIYAIELILIAYIIYIMLRKIKTLFTS